MKSYFLLVGMVVVLSGCTPPEVKLIRDLSDDLSRLNGQLQSAIESENWSEVKSVSRKLDQIDTQLQGIMDGERDLDYERAR